MINSEKIKASNRKTQETFRERQRELGRTRREFWLTNDERKALEVSLAQLRDGLTPTISQDNG